LANPIREIMQSFCSTQKKSNNC